MDTPSLQLFDKSAWGVNGSIVAQLTKTILSMQEPSSKNVHVDHTLHLLTKLSTDANKFIESLNTFSLTLAESCACGGDNNEKIVQKRCAPTCSCHSSDSQELDCKPLEYESDDNLIPPEESNVEKECQNRIIEEEFTEISTYSIDPVTSKLNMKNPATQRFICSDDDNFNAEGYGRVELVNNLILKTSNELRRCDGCLVIKENSPKKMWCGCENLKRQSPFYLDDLTKVTEDFSANKDEPILKAKGRSPCTSPTCSGLSKHGSREERGNAEARSTIKENTALTECPVSSYSKIGDTGPSSIRCISKEDKQCTPSSCSGGDKPSSPSKRRSRHGGRNSCNAAVITTDQEQSPEIERASIKSSSSIRNKPSSPSNHSNKDSGRNSYTSAVVIDCQLLECECDDNLFQPRESHLEKECQDRIIEEDFTKISTYSIDPVTSKLNIKNQATQTFICSDDDNLNAEGYGGVETVNKLILITNNDLRRCGGCQVIKENSPKKMCCGYENLKKQSLFYFDDLTEVTDDFSANKDEPILTAKERSPCTSSTCCGLSKHGSREGRCIAEARSTIKEKTALTECPVSSYSKIGESRPSSIRRISREDKPCTPSSCSGGDKPSSPSNRRSRDVGRNSSTSDVITTDQEQFPEIGKTSIKSSRHKPSWPSKYSNKDSGPNSYTSAVAIDCQSLECECDNNLCQPRESNLEKECQDRIIEEEFTEISTYSIDPVTSKLNIKNQAKQTFICSKDENLNAEGYERIESVNKLILKTNDELKRCSGCQVIKENSPKKMCCGCENLKKQSPFYLDDLTEVTEDFSTSKDEPILIERKERSPCISCSGSSKHGGREGRDNAEARSAIKENTAPTECPVNSYSKMGDSRPSSIRCTSKEDIPCTPSNCCGGDKPFSVSNRRNRNGGALYTSTVITTDQEQSPEIERTSIKSSSSVRNKLSSPGKHSDKDGGRNSYTSAVITTDQELTHEIERTSIKSSSSVRNRPSSPSKRSTKEDGSTSYTSAVVTTDQAQSPEIERTSIKSSSSVRNRPSSPSKRSSKDDGRTSYTSALSMGDQDQYPEIEKTSIKSSSSVRNRPSSPSKRSSKDDGRTSYTSAVIMTDQEQSPKIERTSIQSSSSVRNKLTSPSKHSNKDGGRNSYTSAVITTDQEQSHEIERRSVINSSSVRNSPSSPSKHRSKDDVRTSYTSAVITTDQEQSPKIERISIKGSSSVRNKLALKSKHSNKDGDRNSNMSAVITTDQEQTHEIERISVVNSSSVRNRSSSPSKRSNKGGGRNLYTFAAITTDQKQSPEIERTSIQGSSSIRNKLSSPSKHTNKDGGSNSYTSAVITTNQEQSHEIGRTSIKSSSSVRNRPSSPSKRSSKDGGRTSYTSAVITTDQKESHEIEKTSIKGSSSVINRPSSPSKPSSKDGGRTSYTSAVITTDQKESHEIEKTSIKGSRSVRNRPSSPSKRSSKDGGRTLYTTAVDTTDQEQSPETERTSIKGSSSVKNRPSSPSRLSSKVGDRNSYTSVVITTDKEQSPEIERKSITSGSSVRNRPSSPNKRSNKDGGRNSYTSAVITPDQEQSPEIERTRIKSSSSVKNRPSLASKLSSKDGDRNLYTSVVITTDKEQSPEIERNSITSGSSGRNRPSSPSKRSNKDGGRNSYTSAVDTTDQEQSPEIKKTSYKSSSCVRNRPSSPCKLRNKDGGRNSYTSAVITPDQEQSPEIERTRNKSGSSTRNRSSSPSKRSNKDGGRNSYTSGLITTDQEQSPEIERKSYKSSSSVRNRPSSPNKRSNKDGGCNSYTSAVITPDQEQSPVIERTIFKSSSSVRNTPCSPSKRSNKDGCRTLYTSAVDTTDQEQSPEIEKTSFKISSFVAGKPSSLSKCNSAESHRNAADAADIITDIGISRQIIRGGTERSRREIGTVPATASLLKNVSGKQQQYESLKNEILSKRSSEKRLPSPSHSVVSQRISPVNMKHSSINSSTNEGRTPFMSTSITTDQGPSTEIRKIDTERSRISTRVLSIGKKNSVASKRSSVDGHRNASISSSIMTAKEISTEIKRSSTERSRSFVDSGTARLCNCATSLPFKNIQSYEQTQYELVENELPYEGSTGRPTSCSRSAVRQQTSPAKIKHSDQNGGCSFTRFNCSAKHIDSRFEAVPGSFECGTCKEDDDKTCCACGGTKPKLSKQKVKEAQPISSSSEPEPLSTVSTYIEKRLSKDLATSLSMTVLNQEASDTDANIAALPELDERSDEEPLLASSSTSETCSIPTIPVKHGRQYMPLSSVETKLCETEPSSGEGRSASRPAFRYSANFTHQANVILPTRSFSTNTEENEEQRKARSAESSQTHASKRLIDDNRYTARILTGSSTKPEPIVSEINRRSKKEKSEFQAITGSESASGDTKRNIKDIANLFPNDIANEPNQTEKTSSRCFTDTVTQNGEDEPFIAPTSISRSKPDSSPREQHIGSKMSLRLIRPGTEVGESFETEQKQQSEADADISGKTVSSNTEVGELFATDQMQQKKANGDISGKSISSGTEAGELFGTEQKQQSEAGTDISIKSISLDSDLEESFEAEQKQQNKADADISRKSISSDTEAGESFEIEQKQQSEAGDDIFRQSISSDTEAEELFGTEQMQQNKSVADISRKPVSPYTEVEESTERKQQSEAGDEVSKKPAGSDSGVGESFGRKQRQQGKAGADISRKAVSSDCGVGGQPYSAQLLDQQRKLSIDKHVCTPACIEWPAVADDCVCRYHSQYLSMPPLDTSHVNKWLGRFTEANEKLAKLRTKVEYFSLGNQITDYCEIVPPWCEKCCEPTPPPKQIVHGLGRLYAAGSSPSVHRRRIYHRTGLHWQFPRRPCLRQKFSKRNLHFRTYAPRRERWPELDDNASCCSGTNQHLHYMPTTVSPVKYSTRTPCTDSPSLISLEAIPVQPTTMASIHRRSDNSPKACRKHAN